MTLKRPIDKEKIINYLAVIIFPFSIISLETILFHLLMIVSNYLQAVTVISIAMFGIALGGMVSFYLLKVNRNFVLSLFSGIFFVSIGLSYYNIIRLDNFEFPYLLILPFFSGSVIVSSIFSRENSHKIYFVDLTASAIGVVFPIVAVAAFKSENTLLILSILPLVFLIIILFSVRNLFIRIIGLIVTTIVIAATIRFILLNISIPREIDQYDFHYNIIPYVNIPLEAQLLKDLYQIDSKNETFTLTTNDPYEEQIARNIINKTKYYPFVMDLSRNYQPSRFAEKYMKIYTNKLNKYTFLFSEDNLMGRVEYITKTDKDLFYINNGAFFDRVHYRDKGSFWDIRFPNYLSDANVFIMGASADGIVKPLKKLQGKTKITGVEFNPIIHKTMTSGYYFYKSNKAYEDTTIYKTEGRAYLKGTDEKFDMITHMNNHAEHGAVCTLAPEYLHTVEGIKEMLEKLTDRGILVYEEILWSTRSEWSFYKFINTIKASLHELGVKDPANHILVYKWDYWNYEKPGVRSVVIKRIPFNESEKSKVRAYLAFHINKKFSQLQSEKNVLAFPGIIKSNIVNDIITGKTGDYFIGLPDYYFEDDFEKNILSYIKNKSDREFIESLYIHYPRKNVDIGWDFVSTIYNYKQGRYILKENISNADKKRFIQLLDKTNYSYNIDISPIRDDKPFPYNVYKEKKEVYNILKIASLLSLLILIPVLILVIKKYSTHKLILLEHSIFFVAVGLGFMLVEIALMQFFQRFIGMPTYSVIITLGSLLLFSGIGSFISRDWKNRYIVTAVFVIPVMIFLYYNYLNTVFDFFSASTFNIRIAAAVALMFPLSLLMGIPFPKAMEKIKREISNEYAVLMYAVSGAAGAIAAVAALVLNTTYGFSFTFICGMCAYFMGALMLLFILRTGMSNKF
ncbi:MAG: hypothetical protein FWH53_01665 [Leptospirales bacterium]|nr:hypothetical protein [Leptospirales bacterium]